MEIYGNTREYVRKCGNIIDYDRELKQIVIQSEQCDIFDENILFFVNCK